jgi:uncharacterized protein (TIGR00251 family)
MPDGALQEHPDRVILTLRVQPRASRSEIVDVRDGAIRMRLAAPPVEGAANAALLELLSKALDVRKSELEIVSGERGRSKRVLARGLTAREVEERLRIASAS